jgi:glycosyltransferase involved in cell wall biosynthesis
LACSEWVRGELARNGIESEFVMLPVPRPGAQFERRPAAEAVFLFVGRLDREKGVELLVRAFARLYVSHPSARLRIAGRGPLREHLEGVARELGVAGAVDFCGWLSPGEVERQLRDAWALVVPSLWAEPLGLVAVEAVTRGVPVIASASGGLAEVVEDGVSGLLFRNNDEDALLARLRSIASGEAFPEHTLTAEVMSRALDTFGIERHIALMRRIFAETIDKTSHL